MVSATATGRSPVSGLVGVRPKHRRSVFCEPARLFGADRHTGPSAAKGTPITPFGGQTCRTDHRLSIGVATCSRRRRQARRVVEPIGGRSEPDP